MWIWWTKINRNPSILGRLSVIKWSNWTGWENYLNTEISDGTQIAVVVWPQCKTFGPYSKRDWLIGNMDFPMHRWTHMMYQSRISRNSVTQNFKESVGFIWLDKLLNISHWGAIIFVLYNHHKSHWRLIGHETCAQIEHRFGYKLGAWVV